jgi:DNA-binding SARP family transcriptional activator/predicted negative regulator of RcsB-dependent stress response
LGKSYNSFLFWPDQPESQSRNNLRQTLHRLRLTLPNHEQYLMVDSGFVGWRYDSPFRLDVADFEAALEKANKAEAAGQPEALRQNLEYAISLYHGELLPSCYDDWITPHRERLRRQCLSALEKIAASLEDQRTYTSACSYARRLLEVDPLYEPGYRLLMRLYALLDDRTSAIRTYQACAEILQRELSVEPEPTTRMIHQRLLAVQPVREFTSIQAGQTHLPLVGREAEWTRLYSAWQEAAKGKVQLALISGEAGIGKSRLAEEMLVWLARQGIHFTRTRGYAAEGRISYSQLADWLRSDVYSAVLHRMEKVWLTEVARLLPELLVEIPHLPPPEPLVEYTQRQRFFQALARAILAIQQPFLLLIDDLQWCDPETLEFLHYLLRFDAQARLLVVGTLRTGEMAANPALQDFLIHLSTTGLISEIPLKALDSAETAKLAEHFLGSELEVDQALHLYRETEGNPLFVVETLRSGVQTTSESKTSRPFNLAQDPASLPERVQAVIAARLVQLSSPAHRLVGLAATIGRDFRLDVLGVASDLEEDDLLHWLDELWQKQIIRQAGENSFEFTHDKLREVAYAELGPLQSLINHRHVARAIETVHSADLDPVSGELAVHLERANRPAEAVAYYHRAGLLNQRVGAHAEALRLLKKALELLQAFPPGTERDEKELDYLITLGALLVQRQSHGSTEVLQIYERALALCQQLDRPTPPPVLRALAIINITSAKFKDARKLGEQVLNISKDEDSNFLRIEAHYTLGVSNFWLGEFLLSREHLEKAIACYDPDQSQFHTLSYAQDPKVVCQVRLAFVLWCLGYPDQAVKASQEAVVYAKEIGHLYSQAYATYWETLLYNHMKNYEYGYQSAEDLLALSQEENILYWPLDGLVILGWAQAELGDRDAGISSIRAGLSDPLLKEYRFLQPLRLSLLGEQAAKSGDNERGLSLLDQSLAIMEQNEERWCKSELFRRKGEILLRSGNPASAEAAFQFALSAARDQEAKMLELRGAVQLAGLWQSQGRSAEAKQLLSPIFDWFSEGWDTVDLREAIQLLSAL